ncbi:MAG: MoxR family ATPase [Bacteroidota bacterium]
MKKKSRYIVAPGQQYALDAAVELGQPLLLTGEPGTGKTMMASWAVDYLSEKFPNSFHPHLLRFNTKTTSKASDLFYTYDALSHFQAANLRGDHSTKTEDFISLEAFGQAIALSDPKAEFGERFGMDLPEKSLDSVVLIDEVDKAPRDFTNDLLDEIENYRFRIKELQGATYTKKEDVKVVVIMTSNSEKNLPDAFLRRCAFYHIEFPKGDQLRRIIEIHLGEITKETKTAYDFLIDFFEKARNKAVRKKPATAELIAWLKLLEMEGFHHEQDQGKRKHMLERNLSFLVKTKDDLEAIKTLI